MYLDLSVLELHCEADLLCNRELYGSIWLGKGKVAEGQQQSETTV